MTHPEEGNPVDSRLGAQLRQRVTKLSDRIGYLENVCIGLVELLHEHGIDAAPIDGLDDYDPAASVEGGERG